MKNVYALVIVGLLFSQVTYARSLPFLTTIANTTGQTISVSVEQDSSRGGFCLNGSRQFSIQNNQHWNGNSALTIWPVGESFCRNSFTISNAQNNQILCNISTLISLKSFVFNRSARSYVTNASCRPGYTVNKISGGRAILLRISK